MRISIAMTTYNGGEYIKEQLLSLANQSTLPYELIICDDGSTDDTLVIIDELSKKLPFTVRVYKNKKNLHFTGNFLKAASLCTGDAIAFCDQDDIWEIRKIEVSANALTVHDADLVIHEGRVVDHLNRPIDVKIPDFSGINVEINCAPFDRVSKGFAMVLRRSIIEELMIYWDWTEYFEFKRLYGAPLGHDLLIYAWCIYRKKIFFIEEQLVRYRIHDNNVTANVSITKNYLFKLLFFFRALKFNKSHYHLSSAKWGAEVIFLRNYIYRSKINNHLGLEQLADWLVCKSELWHARSAIYDKQAKRKYRWSNFIFLVYSGGYISRKTPRLGLNAFSKDLIVLLVS